MHVQVMALPVMNEMQAASFVMDSTKRRNSSNHCSSGFFLSFAAEFPHRADTGLGNSLRGPSPRVFPGVIELVIAVKWSENHHRGLLVVRKCERKIVTT